jgi:Family of unknown function (DUF6256)
MAVLPESLRLDVAGRDPTRWLDILRHDIIPVASTFLVFVALLVAYHRARKAGHRTSPRPREGARAADPGWPQLLHYLAGTIIGGYVFFLAIVVVFYFVLGGEQVSLITDALLGGSALAFLIAGPAFILFSWLAERWGRGRHRHPGVSPHR